MSVNADVLYVKLKALPPQRRAEVEDFMDFLARKETRSAALDRLLAIAPALEAAGTETPMTDEEVNAFVNAEIKAYRAEKRAAQDKAKGRS